MHEYLRQTYLRLHEQLVSEGDIGCIVWTGYTTGRLGQKYGRLRRRFPCDEKSRQYGVHQLALMIHMNILEFPKTHIKMHVSHLCHNKLCCNPEHLSYEPQSINNNRQNCEPSKCRHHSIRDTQYPDCIIW